MTKILQTIKLQNSKDGKISIANLSTPYGVGSDDILSIGVCLKQDMPEWKVHIPYENLDELIEALTKIKQNKKQKE